MNVFVTRQPIFNRHQRVFAYELLFRDGVCDAFPGVDGGMDPSRLLSSSFFTAGIEQIANGRKAFIAFTEDMLLSGVPTKFPAQSVVVEILQDVPPTEEVIAACQSLVHKGYMLILNDFVYTGNHLPLLELAKIIRVDFMRASDDHLLELIDIAKKYHCKLLAEKIETHEDYDRAGRLGFFYFQGYFFSKPEILQKKELTSSKMILMQLLMEVNRAGLEVKTLENLIKQDVAISYALLKCLNSAYYSRLQPISSIRQAITFLGEQGTRMFVSLIAIGKLSENKPDELIRVSCIRARFLELLGEELKQDSGAFFVLGLFSLLDVMLDTPMQSLMKQLPVSADISQALVDKTGPYFPYLELVQMLEHGRWSDLDASIQHLGLEEINMMDFYLDGVRWAGYNAG